MRYLTEHAVLPYLQERLGQREAIVTRVLRTVAVGESTIDQAIADLETATNPTVGLSAHPGQTDVRIVAKAASQAEAEAMIAEFEAIIRQRLGAAIFASGDATLEAVVAGLLRQQGHRWPLRKRSRRAISPGAWAAIPICSGAAWWRRTAPASRQSWA